MRSSHFPLRMPTNSHRLVGRIQNVCEPCSVGSQVDGSGSCRWKWTSYPFNQGEQFVLPCSFHSITTTTWLFFLETQERSFVLASLARLGQMWMILTPTSFLPNLITAWTTGMLFLPWRCMFLVNSVDVASRTRSPLRTSSKQRLGQV